MKKNEIQKLATELWFRDNPKRVITMHFKPTEDELKESGHWYIAASRIALRTMCENRRKAKWEQY